ncbi:MAG: ABC transporter ATP-binding protein [Emcibacter sp.]|nr:ABC transporter ATP-binding protein [Emcibacter sp.]
MKGLVIQNITLTLGGAQILKDVSASVKPGEMVGMIGPNGAGKSCLLKSILGLNKPGSGRITLEGRDLSAMSLKERALCLAYAAQGAPLHWPLTVERLVALGRIPHLGPWQKLQPEDDNEIDRALTLTDCLHLKERAATTLSGGERARVLLARTLASGATYILADEPVASLDPFHQLQVMEILKAHAAAGGAVLVVLHDLGLAARTCDRLILLHEGQMIDQGPPAHILSDKNLSRFFGISVSRWQENGKNFLVPHAIHNGQSHE